MIKETWEDRGQYRKYKEERADRYTKQAVALLIVIVILFGFICLY